MSRKYEDNRFREQNIPGQVNRNQRAQNQKYQAEDVRKTPYQPGDIQRRQQTAQDIRRRYNPEKEVRSQRYQQETLAGDWQQDWNRTPYDNRNDKRFTAGQFVLVLIIITLVLSLAAMAAFWYTGRSSLRNLAGSGLTVQQSSEYSAENEMPEDNIVILDMDNEE